MEWDAAFADLPPLEAANPPFHPPPSQSHNPAPPLSNRAASASPPVQSSASVAIPAVVRGISALSSASGTSGTSSPSRRQKASARPSASSATSSSDSSSSSSSSSASSHSSGSEDERRERRKSKKKKNNKKRREREKEKDRTQQQQRDRSASPPPTADANPAVAGMTKAMRLLAATYQRGTSGSSNGGSSSSKSKKKDKDREKDKDSKRSKKDKRRSPVHPTSSASTKSRPRPSSRPQASSAKSDTNSNNGGGGGQQTAQPVPAYLGEYERVVKRLAEEERTLLAAQRKLEAEVRIELERRRKKRERKEEEKGEELNFVARFLLNGTGKGGIALRRPLEEKEQERERRQRGLPMYGSDEQQEDDDEDDDESSHEDEDEDEEEERKRRKQQRLQRRKERREAAEARQAVERARIEQQLVDETVSFIQTLTMEPSSSADDDTEQTARQQAEVGGRVQEVVKVKDEKQEEQKEGEEDVMGRPLSIAKAEEGLFEEPAPSTFDGVEQDAWEKRIVWEDKQVKADEEQRRQQQAAGERRQRCITALQAKEITAPTPVTTSSSDLSFSSFSLPSLSNSTATSQNRPTVQLTWLNTTAAAGRARMRYMGSERILPTQLMLAHPPSAAQHSPTAVTHITREWKGVVLRPVTHSTANSVVLGERLLSHHINQSLLTDDWLDAIVWDESDLHHKRNQLLQHHALLLDQNDPQLLLASTHTLTHLSQTTVAAPPLLDQFKRYNISHDAVKGSDTLSLRVLKILHASFAANLDPLVYRTHLTSTELAQYHRPLLSLPADVSTTMAIKAEGAAASLAQGEEQESRYVPRSLEELSASDGMIILCEYLERHPPLIMNVGMCSQLITYYRKQGELDLHQPEAPDGDVVVLTTKDDSPFLSQLKPGQTVTALTNNMYIAPVIRHTPTPHTFLLVRIVGQNYWTVRALPGGCYIVGQEEPKLSVPYPDRSHAYDLLKKQLEFFIYKRIQKNQRRISQDELGREFGHSVVIDTIARRILKDIGNLDRINGIWNLRPIERPSEEKLQLLCTPEDVCAYEAMRAADSRLKESGVRRFTNVKQISDIIDQLTQDDVSRVAIYIEKQLHLMPWTLTKGYLAARDGKGTLRLTGRGNPFAEGCGYSYINEKVTAKKTTDENFPELQEPKKKTGTNADLRKLTMEEMGAALQKLGMGADEVAKLLRWDRVRAIARLSMEAVQEGKYPNLKRFARQARPTSAKMMEEYRRDIQAIFDRQLAMLGWQGRPDYSHEVDDDVAAVKEKGGARKVRERQGGGGGRSEYLAQKKKEREEEDEYKEFLALREKALKQDQTTTKSTDKSKPAITTTTTEKSNSRLAITNSPNTTTTTSSSTALQPATPALPNSTPNTATAAAGKKKKKVVITKLQHVIKLTNKDGSQTVHTKVYSDKETLRDFVLDCQQAATESSSNGQRLRQRLALNSLPALGDGKKEGKEKGGKEEDEDEEGERQLKGVPQVELVKYARGTKIKTLDAYVAKYTKAGRDQAAAVAASQRFRRGARRAEDEVEYMFTLDDDDWNRAGDPFRFPPDASPTPFSGATGAAGHSAGPASLLTSTSSGTLKLSLKQLHQTPQDVYVKSKMKRKSTADTDSSMSGLMQQPYKRTVLSRRRGDPRVFLSSCLNDILSVVAEFDYAAPFREPVTDEIAEDYADIIHNPMDLKTIKAKCNKNEYDNKEEFLEDVALMRQNCETYNGADSIIAEHARMVEDDIKTMLHSDTYRQRIVDSEDAIEQHQLLTKLDACVGILAQLPDAKIFAVTPNWIEYTDRVDTPLALDTLRERVESKLYGAVGEFMWDVQQMWENSVTYNGNDHMVTQRAEGMINRAREYLLKWYTREQLECSDALVKRLKKEKEKDNTAGLAALAGRSSTGTAGTSTPAMSYQPSSRTSMHGAGASATPGRTVLASPARSDVLASPQLQVGSAGAAASPRMSPSSLRPDSPSMLNTPQISTGEAASAGRSVLRTPALSSSAASPLFSIASAASTPSAATRLPRSSRDPSPLSTAHLPAFSTPSAASSSPAISSTTAFLPSSSSSPSLLHSGGTGGTSDEHDVLSGFGDMDTMFGSGSGSGGGSGGDGLVGDDVLVGVGGGEGVVGGVSDLEMGLGGLVGGDGDDGMGMGMALEDLPPPIEEGGENKDGEDEIDIWN